MNTPPLLLGATLLFWGLQTGMVLPGLMMAVVLEAARVVKLRWEFGQQDYHRAWDFCMVLFLASAIYCFVTRDSANDLMEFFQAANFTQRNRAMSASFTSVFVLFEWWPMVLFPFAVVQAYSTQDRIPTSTFSWYLRRQAARRGGQAGSGINVAWLYFAITLGAAALTNDRDGWFFIGLCLLAAWALWATRPRRFSTVIWLGLLALVCKLGYWSHQSLNTTQGILENKFAGWVTSFSRRQGDRHESATAIGQIGQLKLSGKIVLWAQPEGGAPALLRDSSFNIFRSGGRAAWIAAKREIGKSEFKEASPDVKANDVITFTLLPDQRTEQAVTISTWLQRGRAFLALPHGTTELENLLAERVETNRLGVVRVFGGPALVYFRARHGRGPTADAPPDTGANESGHDLSLPAGEAELIQQIAVDLGLADKPPRERVSAIAAWFAQEFQYTTYLTANATRVAAGSTPMETFLRRTKAGHCEYFATATVLLLRAAGIPARYANGYSLQERDQTGKTYLVRERHAHAWTLYWLDGAWHELDTTPGSWVAEEALNASFWEPFRDYLSNLWQRFTVWRMQSGKGNFQNYLLAALVVLLLVLAGRLFFGRRRARRERTAIAADAPPVWPGADSEFYLVEQRLVELGFARQPGEPLADWLRRLETAPPLVGQPLHPALQLHYRYRFDPRGLSAEERAELQLKVRQWLANTNLQRAESARTPESNTAK